MSEKRYVLCFPDGREVPIQLAPGVLLGYRMGGVAAYTPTLLGRLPERPADHDCRPDVVVRAAPE